MPSRVASFTPLPVHWPHALGPLSSGVSVVERPTFDEDEWRRLCNLRGSEEREILEEGHWLCMESDDESLRGRHTSSQSLAENLQTAMLAFQIWAPKGWSGLIINSEVMDNGSRRVISVPRRPEPYAVSRWGKLLKIDDLSVDELKALIDGTLSALQSDSVPQKNPFQYLKIGLQTAILHIKAGALLWMIGLDALLAAQKDTAFSARLCRLLGRHTLVFPADRFGRQPVYTVGEVASDIYQLRNQIAHGDRIRPEYLEKSEFRFKPAGLPYLRVEECSYQSILCEAALFTLCAALRNVILSGHLDLLKTPKAWKRWLSGDQNATLRLSPLTLLVYLVGGTLA
jgi:hypothetical protein